MIDLEKSLYEQRHEQRRETSHGPMAKTLADLVRYKELIRATRPTLVIETGTWTGASAHWFGYQMVQEGSGAGGAKLGVVTIDLHPAPGLRLFRESREGYGICPLAGSSTDRSPGGPWELAAGIASLTEMRTMVVLDSDHSAAHVLEELELYGPLVSPGCYLVVEDTITRHMAGNGGYVGSPADAVDWYLEDHAGQFEADDALEDLLPTTQNPGGWLRRAA